MVYGSRVLVDLKNSWRCYGCRYLMYNIDAKGYPCEGAPIPLYIDQDYPQVCSLCYDMYSVFLHADQRYWKQPQ